MQETGQRSELDTWICRRWVARTYTKDSRSLMAVCRQGPSHGRPLLLRLMPKVTDRGCGGLSERGRGRSAHRRRCLARRPRAGRVLGSNVGNGLRRGSGVLCAFALGTRALLLRRQAFRGLAVGGGDGCGTYCGADSGAGLTMALCGIRRTRHPSRPGRPGLINLQGAGLPARVRRPAAGYTRSRPLSQCPAPSRRPARSAR